MRKWYSSYFFHENIYNCWSIIAECKSIKYYMILSKNSRIYRNVVQKISRFVGVLKKPLFPLFQSICLIFFGPYVLGVEFDYLAQIRSKLLMSRLDKGNQIFRGKSKHNML